MGYPTPFARRRRHERRLRFAVLAGLALLVAVLLDYWAWRLLAGDPQALEQADWYQALRQLGYLPTWLAIAAVAALAGSRLDDAGTRAHWRDAALRLAGAPIVAGLLAEIIKPIVRRERPINTEGLFVFRPLTDSLLSGSGLGMPSSHTTVAFAAAGVVARVLPGSGPVVLTAAAGCGLTRLLSGAHFLSDVVAGAILGLAVAWWLTPRAGDLP